MAKFILCQVEDTYGSLEVPLGLYRNALTARPVGHVDRPSTLIQLAAVHFARFEKRRDEVEEARVKTLLQEAIELSSTESHEKRAATFVLELHARRRVNPIRADDKSSMEQDSTSRLTDEDLWIFSGQLLHRFKRFGDIADLQQAITLMEEIIKSTSAWDDRYHKGLSNLGMALLYRFERLGELSDLEDAIARQRDAVDLTPLGHPDKPACLNNLGNSFRARFKRLGELSDLEDAILRQRDAVDLTPHGHPDKPGHLNNLGNSFVTRFERLGELSDLEEAILKQRDAVDLTPHGHPDKPGHLNNLGNSFRARFKRLGELSDLEEAILKQRDAVDLTPHGHPDKPARLGNLGNSCFTRFERLGELSDLEEAILRQRDAVNLTPLGHPDNPGRLNNLGSSFFTRFERLGELSDLEDAILTLRDAVDLTPLGHPDKSSRLNNLGSSFFTRFKRLGELSNLEDAILRLRDAVDLTPHGHPDKPVYLNNLGNSFLTRFERLGELSDLEGAISTLRDTVDLIPHGHPDKPAGLTNLGSSFFTRFERLGELSDLEEAILRHRDAVDTRFQRLGELSDLEEAILRQSDAVGLTPHGHPAKPGRLNSLGKSFLTRFERLGELSDLEEAISTLRDAVDLTPHGHPATPGHLATLGASFFSRFERLGELSDLEEAISRQRDAVDLTPHGHPDKPGRLHNLGNSLVARFERLEELSNLEEAISLYFHAASAPVGPIGSQFHASQKWISCARRIHHHSLLHAYSTAISLLPELAWIGLVIAHRYSGLRQGANVVREAAAAALDSGLPETAVEWLEQGRSIVWGELFQLRSSYEDLSSAHPDHARRLRELSAALENAGVTREKSLSTILERAQSAAHPMIESLQREADRHRMLAIERDKLLRQIRGFPGFERFLLHKDFSQLRASTHSGPVVILNAAESRCDALIVLTDVDHVIHVPLPTFTFQRSAGLQKMLAKLLRHVRVIHCDDREGKSATRGCVSWEPLLSALWTGVVKPVLDALAFSVCHVVSFEVVSHLFICLGTDSWGPITHVLVSDWPFRVSSYPRGRFL
jgi:tetratricopeptide (TPR) repeat protein